MPLKQQIIIFTLLKNTQKLKISIITQKKTPKWSIQVNAFSKVHYPLNMLKARVLSCKNFQNFSFEILGIIHETLTQKTPPMVLTQQFENFI